MTSKKLTFKEFESLPLHIRAGAYACSQKGNLANGVSSDHLLAAGAYLLSQGIKDEVLLANIAKSYEAMLAESLTYNS